MTTPYGKIRKDLIPSEEAEQRALAQWLDLHRILWCHVPNGGQRSKAVAGKLKAAGVKAGVPDCLVFDRPARCAGDGPMCAHPPMWDVDQGEGKHCSYTLKKHGVAIELKRARGAPSNVSEHQRAWVDALAKRGWLVVICYGASEAIALLESLGFGRAR